MVDATHCIINYGLVKCYGMDEYNSARWTNAVKLVTTAVECVATHGLTGCTVPDNLLNDELPLRTHYVSHTPENIRK